MEYHRESSAVVCVLDAFDHHNPNLIFIHGAHALYTNNHDANCPMLTHNFLTYRKSSVQKCSVNVAEIDISIEVIMPDVTSLL